MAGDQYTQICSSEDGECASPLLGADSSPENRACAEIAAAGNSDDNNNQEFESDSDTGLIKLWWTHF